MERGKGLKVLGCQEGEIGVGADSDTMAWIIFGSDLFLVPDSLRQAAKKVILVLVTWEEVAHIAMLLLCVQVVVTH